MTHNTLIIQLKNPAYNKKGYLTFVSEDEEGRMAYGMSFALKEAMPYFMEDVENEYSLLNTHLNVLAENYPEVETEVQVLTIATTPLSVWENKR